LGAFFGLFANSARMKIFCCLQNGPQSVSQIADAVNITIANASQHLRPMRELGAVNAMRSGRRIYYHIADQRFVEAASLVAQALSELDRSNVSARFRPSGDSEFGLSRSQRVTKC
jgi:ArsR family transcriptional regulator